MAVTKTPSTVYIGKEFQAGAGYVHVQSFGSPAAAAAAGVLSAHALDGSLVSAFAGQPDVPRNLQIVASGTATGNVVITGTNIRGVVITETIALNGATPVLGLKAFATVTSIQLPTVGATTINVGTGVKLGLDRMIPSDLVLATSVNGAYETTRPTVAHSTSAIESNTIQTNTAPNGSKPIIATYITQDLEV